MITQNDLNVLERSKKIIKTLNYHGYNCELVDGDKNLFRVIESSSLPDGSVPCLPAEYVSEGYATRRDCLRIDKENKQLKEKYHKDVEEWERNFG